MIEASKRPSMQSFLRKAQVWFFPTKYFENPSDLKEWQESYRKEYAVFSRMIALYATLVCVALYFIIDIHRYFPEVGLYRVTTILFSWLLCLYSYTGHFKVSRFYKLPVILFAIYISSFQVYYVLYVDQNVPVFYMYFIPFIVVWLCQIGSGFSALMLTILLIPISILLVKVYPNNPQYSYHSVSLVLLLVPVIFMMRIEMLNKIKYFFLNKKYLEEARLRYEETRLRYKELGELASQVAHDIRSPLSAVMILAKDNPNIPEASRILFRTGVNRILDITNDLLNKARAFLDSTREYQAVEKVEKNSVHLVTDIIDNIVSEKRVEYRSKLGVQIQTNFGLGSFGLFANVQRSELKRIISNLINNSVYAVGNNGKIEISAEIVSDTIEITIQDNGCGIPEEILPKLLHRGASFNKDANNLGVGLYHAKTKLNSWGGDITISSVVDKGTKVTIALPACVAPKWLAKKVEILPNSKVVILDDDLAIHQVWDKRFENLNTKGVEFFHLSTVDQFESWFNKNSDLNTLYLVDYELLGQSKNGIEIIRGFNIQDKSILVTSRSEEQGLIDKCLKLDIKILPKISADLVPIVTN